MEGGNKNKCPICGNESHKWLEVYTVNNSKLNKMENMSISWCNQINDYVLITLIKEFLFIN